MSTFVIHPVNKAPRIDVKTNPVRYIYTDIPQPFDRSFIEIKDDGVGWITMNITVTDGNLDVASTAWYETGPDYRQRFPARRLYREEIQDINWVATKYSISGTVDQINAALHNMTFVEDMIHYRP